WRSTPSGRGSRRTARWRTRRWSGAASARCRTREPRRADPSHLSYHSGGAHPAREERARWVSSSARRAPDLDQERQIRQWLRRVHEHNLLAAHLQLAPDPPEPMRRAPDPPVHLALGLDRELREGEVRLDD